MSEAYWRCSTRRAIQRQSFWSPRRTPSMQSCAVSPLIELIASCMQMSICGFRREGKELHYEDSMRGIPIERPLCVKYLYPCKFRTTGFGVSVHPRKQESLLSCCRDLASEGRQDREPEQPGHHRPAAMATVACGFRKVACQHPAAGMR